MEPASVYALTSPSGLLYREWDGEAVVFNPASGSTHRLPGAAAVVLRWLEAQPADLDGLVSGLADVVPDMHEQLRPWLSALLAECERAGLVERR